MNSVCSYTLGELAERFGGTVVGDRATILTGVAAIDSAQADQVAFLANPRYRHHLTDTAAGCVILSSEMASECRSNALVCDDPYLMFAKVSTLFDAKQRFTKGVHTSAVIADDVVLGHEVNVGAQAVIESGCIVDAGSSIGGGCYLGHGVQIGRNTKIMANVTLHVGTVVGDNCIIHSGAVIGADGFGFARDGDEWFKIPQVAGVKIGNDVEVGANTCVDCGALHDTVISDGVKLDNLIQIGHGVSIGEHTAMAGGTAVGGSTVIGSHCTIGGMSAINSHVEIASHVFVTGMSAVTKSITSPGTYSGNPAIEAIKWRKRNARVNQIEGLLKRIRKLETNNK